MMQTIKRYYCKAILLLFQQFFCKYVSYLEWLWSDIELEKYNTYFSKYWCLFASFNI